MDAFPSALATYSVQILLMVVSAACASAMIRVRAPHVRLIYWRFILAVCLLLPLAPPHFVDVDVATGTQVTAAVTGACQHFGERRRADVPICVGLGVERRKSCTMGCEEALDRLRLSLVADQVHVQVVAPQALAAGRWAPHRYRNSADES